MCVDLVSFVQMSGRTLDERIQTGPEISSRFLSTNPTGWKGHLIALLYREQHKTRASEAAAEANTALGAVGHLLAVIQSLPTTQRPRCSPPDEHDRKPYQSKIQLGSRWLPSIERSCYVRVQPSCRSGAFRCENTSCDWPTTASQARLEPAPARRCAAVEQKLFPGFSAASTGALALKLALSWRCNYSPHLSSQAKMKKNTGTYPFPTTLFCCEIL